VDHDDAFDGHEIQTWTGAATLSTSEFKRSLNLKVASKGRVLWRHHLGEIVSQGHRPARPQGRHGEAAIFHSGRVTISNFHASSNKSSASAQVLFVGTHVL